MIEPPPPQAIEQKKDMSEVAIFHALRRSVLFKCSNVIHDL